MKLRKNQKVTFKAIDDFTGKEIQLKGVIVSEALRYIQAHQDREFHLKEEYGEILEDEAYIVKENSNFVRLHLVLLDDILKIKK